MGQNVGELEALRATLAARDKELAKTKANFEQQTASVVRARGGGWARA